jgi:pyruvate kinase
MGVHSNIAAMGRRSPAMGERKNMRAALLDTKGPEVRTGLLADGAKSITLEEGAAIELTYDPAARECGTAARLYCDYQQLATTVGPGSMILLDDGLIALEVEATRPAREGGDPHGAVECRVRNGGVLGATKGVNLPGAILELPAMTEKDKDDLRWCVENDFDYVAASFVRKAHDVRSVVAFLERCCDDVRRARAKAQGVPPEDVEVLRPLVISKIESQEGVLNFDEILAASDGIMVARGDLGVEIPFAELLVIQKRMVRQCNEAGKPVIVATQMLDSMQRNPRPTRAEVTDVGNGA